MPASLPKSPSLATAISLCDDDEFFSSSSSTGSYNCSTNICRSLSTCSSSSLATAKKRSIYSVPVRRVMVMRHAERMDDLFPDWVNQCFHNGRYHARDLNQPMRLPVRRDHPIDYQLDTPITEMGYVTAQMLGRALLTMRTRPDVIFCSPSLRCVQTACAIIRSAKCSDLRVKIEPGLFENVSAYPNGRPAFVQPSKLIDGGFPVDMDYEPLVQAEQLWTKESEPVKQYVERVINVVNELINKLYEYPKPKDLTVLIVAHASTVDLAPRWLRGDQVMITQRELDTITDFYPYCSLVMLQRVIDNDDRDEQPEQKTTNWRIMDDAIPAISTSKWSSKIDARFFNRHRHLKP